MASVEEVELALEGRFRANKDRKRSRSERRCWITEHYLQYPSYVPCSGNLTPFIGVYETELYVLGCARHAEELQRLGWNPYKGETNENK